MNIWTDCKKIQLTDCLNFIVDNRGKTVPTTDNGIILIATNCISNDSLYPKYEKIRYLSQETYDSFFRAHPKPGDIIFVNKGTPGRVCMVPNIVDFCIAQDMIALRVNEQLIDNYYLLAILRSKEIQSQIENTSVGDVIPHFKKQFLNTLLIPIPEISFQKKIGEIYKILSIKIETNNKLNEKLEEMAQAIFKSWFVDFEPFKDKPFHETELGMIPEGWEVSTFSSIIEKLISGDWGKETPTGNYVHKVACIRGCDFENIKNGLRGKTPERFILERNFALKQPKPNDIVVEMSGGTATVSTGRICYITKELLDQYEGDIVCTNFCKIVRPLKGWSQYLYYYWQYKYDKKVMFCYENGTSGIKNFAINDFIDFESILIPPKDELIKFNSIIDNIRVKIQMNGVENTRLASLRDTLLPRLMSGELIV